MCVCVFVLFHFVCWHGAERFHSEITPGRVRRLYEIQPRLVTCEANALLTVLSIQRTLAEAGGHVFVSGQWAPEKVLRDQATVGYPCPHTHALRELTTGSGEGCRDVPAPPF